MNRRRHHSCSCVMLYDTVDLKMGRHKPLKAGSFLQLVTEVEGCRVWERLDTIVALKMEGPHEKEYGSPWVAESNPSTLADTSQNIVPQSFSSVQFSHSVVCDSLWPYGLQHARPPCPSPTPGACSNSCPLSWWCHPAISSSVIPFSPAFNLSQPQDLFQWVSSSHQVAKVLEFQFQHQSFQWIFRTDFLYDLLVWSPCSPRDSQESSPTPQFKSISSLVLSCLYSPTLTSVHDYWKTHSFD